MNGKISTIKQYATCHNIPICQDVALDYILKYIKENRVKNILEIGSAIGYSAIKMASEVKDIKVTTLEKDENRYQMAKKNIKNCQLDKQIVIHYVDALEYLPEEKFDLIFIDASKTKNIEFFQRFIPFLKEDGTVITDNLSFHNLVENPSLIKTKNQKKIVDKIIKYKEYLNNLAEFKTIYLKKGDTLAITKRRS